MSISRFGITSLDLTQIRVYGWFSENPETRGMDRKLYLIVKEDCHGESKHFYQFGN